MKKALIFCAAGAILDLVTTFIILTYYGGVELNPVMDTIIHDGGWPLAIIVKVAATIIFPWILHHFKLITTKVFWIAGILQWAIVAWNSVIIILSLIYG